MLFWFKKLSVDFRYFRVFVFLPYNIFENVESTENFILTALWGDIFSKHNLLMSLLIWLSIWWLLWNFPSFPWFPAFPTISGNRPGHFRRLIFYSNLSYMVISVQSQNIINGKHSDETSDVILLPSTCHH